MDLILQSAADFYDTWRTDSRRQENECSNFGNDSADIRIRIRINHLEIGIRIREQILALRYLTALV